MTKGPGSTKWKGQVSIGTGAADPNVTRTRMAAKQAVKALLSLMNDTATLHDTLMQWLSSSPTARVIDREVGDLRSDLAGGAPVLSYVCYNVDLRMDEVKTLDPSLKDEVIESLSAMDAPENMDTLHRLGVLGANRDIQAQHFPNAFDLA
jgi:hypothetical protein